LKDVTLLKPGELYGVRPNGHAALSQDASKDKQNPDLAKVYKNAFDPD
jgi:hypothetical protein